MNFKPLPEGYIIHSDNDDCKCGRCEPADLENVTVGSILSNNPACEYPACITMGEICCWGPTPCFQIPLALEEIS